MMKKYIFLCQVAEGHMNLEQETTVAYTVSVPQIATAEFRSSLNHLCAKKWVSTRSPQDPA